MKRIFIDIETLPTAEENRSFVEEKLRERLSKKGDEADGEKFQVLAENSFKDTALRGSLGTLLCIGLMVDDGDKVLHEGVFGCCRKTGEFHLNERETLAKFWNYLGSVVRFDAQRDLLIGHNILCFDLPFLYQRSIIWGERPAFELDFYPYQDRPIFDTMRQWTKKNFREFVSLEELALAFGLRCPKAGKVSGENLQAAFLAGQHAEIRKYCLADVACAREVYYRMTFQTMPSRNETVKHSATSV
jgi:hypothetical protein